MLGIDLIGRIRERRALHALRRRLAGELAQDLGLRVLPSLRTLPLTLVGDAGAHFVPGDVQSIAPRVLLAGAPGSGRRLALRQIVLSWIEHPAPDGFVPLPFDLTRIDDGATRPDTILAAHLHAAFRAEPEREPDFDLPLAPLALESAGDAPRWLLLISGWEDLAPQRRAAWREAIEGRLYAWPATRVVVAAPAGEPTWRGFTRLTTPAPARDLLERWAAHLAPTAHAELLAALASEGRPGPLGERLLDVALAALVVPRSGAPASRADLYRRALALLFRATPEQLDHAPLLRDLQRLAAYGERPESLPRGLTVVGADGAPHFIHPQLRRFLAARQLVADGRVASLLGRDAVERGELAVLAAGMLDEPGQLYRALWAGARRDPSLLLTLARCLRERRPAGPVWALRICLALAGASQPEARALLDDCLPALDRALAQAAERPRPPRRFLRRLLAALPGDLALPRIAHIAHAPIPSEALGWDLAEMLAQAGPDRLADLPEGAAPGEQAALARWAYVQSLGGAGRQRLAAAGVQAVRALGARGVSPRRRCAAASALLGDQQMPLPIRLEALALLRTVGSSEAQAQIERAGFDEAPELRAAALAALSAHSRSRAGETLERMAADTQAPWEVRLDAIRRVGAAQVPGGAELLRRCAADTTLPLHVRLVATSRLARLPAGAALLLTLVGDGRCHVVVRAAAARGLFRSAGARSARLALRGPVRGARVGRRPVGAAMRRSWARPPITAPIAPLGAWRAVVALLDDPATPSQLAAELCGALARLGGPQALEALLRVLERAACDTRLTVAALDAIGRLGDASAVAPLRPLLGAEALGRMQRAVPQALLRQTSARCLESGQLPHQMARRLEMAVAESLIPADQPTTLAEFLLAEADCVRSAAARAVAAIGGDAARAAILAALSEGSTGGATAQLLAALVSIEGARGRGCAAVGALVCDPAVPQQTRWLGVQCLAEHPAAEDVMRQALARTDLDPFTRGALADALGRRGAHGALQLLALLARDPQGDPQLRAQALAGLGQLNDVASEAVLLSIICDPNEDVMLRGEAAEQLPAQLSDDARRALRGLLHGERLPVPLVVGALGALGRARDRDALPLMLRHSLDEHGAVVQAAIAALASIGDATVTPALVRISQSPSVDRVIRLQAIGALLRIGDDDYQLLLRAYLQGGTLPLQLQAVEHMIAGGAPAATLLAMLAEPGWPLVVRLRLLEQVCGEPEAAPFLAAILGNASEPDQLRGRAAQALGGFGDGTVVATLAAAADDREAPIAVRLRAIASLRASGGHQALETLSRLAEDAAQPWAIRERAGQLLTN